MKLANASKIKMITFPRLKEHIYSQGETFEPERIRNLTEGAVIRLSLCQVVCTGGLEHAGIRQIQ